MSFTLPALTALPVHALTKGDLLYGEQHQNRPNEFLINTAEPLLIETIERKLLGGWEVTGRTVGGTRKTRLIDAAWVLVASS